MQNVRGDTSELEAECPGGHSALVQSVRGDIFGGGQFVLWTPVTNCDPGPAQPAV